MYESDSISRYLKVLAYVSNRDRKMPEQLEKEKPEDLTDDQKTQNAITLSRKERR